MAQQNKFYAWQDTVPGLVLIIIFNLFVVYGFTLLALDSGSLLHYFIILVFLALTIGQTIKLVGKLRRRG